MSELIKIRKKAQVTLPQSVRQKLGIEEGDLLDVSVRNGEIVLRVKKLIDKSQAWFWTERWQQGEREAEADIKAGRVHSFNDIGEAINFLNEKTDKKNIDGTAKGKILGTEIASPPDLASVSLRFIGMVSQ